MDSSVLVTVPSGDWVTIFSLDFTVPSLLTLLLLVSETFRSHPISRTENAKARAARQILKVLFFFIILSFHKGQCNLAVFDGGVLPRDSQREFQRVGNSRAPGSLGTVLNALAGVFNVLAKAMGGVAGGADHRQEGRHKEQDNDSFDASVHMFIEIAFVYRQEREQVEGHYPWCGSKRLPLNHLHVYRTLSRWSSVQPCRANRLTFASCAMQVAILRLLKEIQREVQTFPSVIKELVGTE